MRKLLLILVLVSSSVVAQINCKPVRMNDPVITITPSLANGIAVEIFLSEIERISPSYLKHGGTPPQISVGLIIRLEFMGISMKSA